MKACENCGHENNEAAEFCATCGIALDAVELLMNPSSEGELFCVFCGSNNTSEVRSCRTCHADLAPPEPPNEDMWLADSEADELPEMDWKSDYEQGFSYPDWLEWEQQIQQQYSPPQWDAAWRKGMRHWLRKIRDGAGGSYRCYESKNFLLLSAEGRKVGQAILQFAERAQDVIEDQFGQLASEDRDKCALLAFSDVDDYCAYIARFHPDGVSAMSSGICIQTGLAHIAWPFYSVNASQGVVIHELVHYNLTGFQLPRWLDEGLAQRIETLVGTVVAVGLDREKAERHREFWTPERIQEFWAGLTFHRPESTELSYHLSLMLVELLATHRESFTNFVREADWTDSGQDAAMRFLDRDLEQVLSGLLGEGNWRPNRKRIAELLLSSSDASNSPAGRG